MLNNYEFRKLIINSSIPMQSYYMFIPHSNSTLDINGFLEAAS